MTMLQYKQVTKSNSPLTDQVYQRIEQLSDSRATTTIEHSRWRIWRSAWGLDVPFLYVLHYFLISGNLD